MRSPADPVETRPFGLQLGNVRRLCFQGRRRGASHHIPMRRRVYSSATMRSAVLAWSRLPPPYTRPNIRDVPVRRSTACCRHGSRLSAIRCGWVKCTANGSSLWNRYRHRPDAAHAGHCRRRRGANSVASAARCQSANSSCSGAPCARRLPVEEAGGRGRRCAAHRAYRSTCLAGLDDQVSHLCPRRGRTGYGRRRRSLGPLVVLVFSQPAAVNGPNRVVLGSASASMWAQVDNEGWCHPPSFHLFSGARSGPCLTGSRASHRPKKRARKTTRGPTRGRPPRPNPNHQPVRCSRPTASPSTLLACYRSPRSCGDDLVRTPR